MADSSISRGASEDNRPWVAITKILYAPLSFRVSAAARKLSTSSMMSSCQIKDRAKGTSTPVKTGQTSRKKEEPGHLRQSRQNGGMFLRLHPTALLGFSHKSPPTQHLPLARKLLAHSRPWEVGRSVGRLWNTQESFFFWMLSTLSNGTTYFKGFPKHFLILSYSLYGKTWHGGFVWLLVLRCSGCSEGLGSSDSPTLDGSTYKPTPVSPAQQFLWKTSQLYLLICIYVCVHEYHITYVEIRD